MTARYTPNLLWYEARAARVRGETLDHCPPCPLPDAVLLDISRAPWALSAAQASVNAGFGDDAGLLAEASAGAGAATQSEAA